jgi:hypothetical protein
LFNEQQRDWICNKLGKEIYRQFDLELIKEQAEADGFVTFEQPRQLVWLRKEIVDHWGADVIQKRIDEGANLDDFTCDEVMQPLLAKWRAERGIVLEGTESDTTVPETDIETKS